MESSNPILNRYGRGYASMETGSDQDLEQLYNAPAASSIRTGRLTIDDVVTRTALLFGLLVISGGVAWTLNFGQGPLMISLFAALGLSLVISFSRKVRPALVIAYAVLEGVVLGTLSNFYNQAYSGIVVQAVIASLAAFASSPVPTTGTSGLINGTAWRCMFDPISARLASSCSRNGINDALKPTIWLGATSMNSTSFLSRIGKSPV